MKDPDYSQPPAPKSTTLEFGYIHPLQAGKVLGMMYAALGLIIGPFVLLGSIEGGAKGAWPVGVAIAMVLVYTIAGFLGGALLACLYNFVARAVGGLRIDLK